MYCIVKDEIHNALGWKIRLREVQALVSHVQRRSTRIMQRGYNDMNKHYYTAVPIFIFLCFISHKYINRSQ